MVVQNLSSLYSLGPDPFRGRGAEYCCLTSASILFHLSWLSGDSLFQASAMACVGDKLKRGQIARERSDSRSREGKS